MALQLITSANSHAQHRFALPAASYAPADTLELTTTSKIVSEHLLRKSPEGSWGCFLCGKFAHSAEVFGSPRVGFCTRKDIRLQALHHSHRLVKAGFFLACTRCGSYASQRVVSLGRACEFDPQRWKQRALVKAWARGFHPIHRVFCWDASLLGLV